MSIKPQTMLDRAEDLVTVGHEDAALQQLHDLIVESRRYSPEFEECVYTATTLAIASQNVRYIRDAVNRLRYLCNSNHMTEATRAMGLASPFIILEKVMRHVLTKTAELTLDAQDQAEQILQDVEDLDSAEKPELFLKRHVLGVATAIVEKEQYMPKIRFQWEVYRTCLELLKYVPQLSSMYLEISCQVFSFCEKLKRSLEFRRICDLLRNHFKSYASSSDSYLKDPEFLKHHIQVRFNQLDTAHALGQYQEAFRTIEDICLLTESGQNPLDRPLHITFLDKLSTLFCESNDWRYSTLVGLDLFSLVTDPEQKSKVANNILVSAMCSLNSKFDVSISDQTFRDATLSEILTGAISAPFEVRDEQMSLKVVQDRVLPMADPDLVQLYLILSGKKTVDVTEVYSQCEPGLKKCGKQKIVERILWLFVFEQLPLFYSSVSFSQLSDILHVEISVLPPRLLEFFSQTSFSPGVSIGRICYLSKSVKFQGPKDTAAAISDTLAVFSSVSQLAHVVRREVNEVTHRALCSEVRNTIKTEHETILHRLQQLEEAKRQEEERELELQREAAERERQRLLDLKKAEEKRKEEEVLRKEAEIEAKRKAIDEAREAQMREIQRLELARRKEQKERDLKLDKLVRRLDYLHRLIRREQIPDLKAEQDEELRMFEERFHQYVVEVKETHFANWEAALAEKKRLDPVMDYADSVLASIREEQGVFLEPEEHHTEEEEEEAPPTSMADALREAEENKRLRRLAQAAEEKPQEPQIVAEVVEEPIRQIATVPEVKAVAAVSPQEAQSRAELMANLNARPKKQVVVAKPEELEEVPLRRAEVVPVSAPVTVDPLELVRERRKQKEASAKAVPAPAKADELSFIEQRRKQMEEAKSEAVPTKQDELSFMKERRKQMEASAKTTPAPAKADELSFMDERRKQMEASAKAAPAAKPEELEEVPLRRAEVVPVSDPVTVDPLELIRERKKQKEASAKAAPAPAIAPPDDKSSLVDQLMRRKRAPSSKAASDDWHTVDRR